MDKRKEINRVIKESLSEALICLMRTKPYKDITITEIINKAGVARATYYRNFDSKEALVREYISTKAMEYAKNNVRGPIDSEESILFSWKYVEKYKDLYALFANAGLSDLLLSSMSDIALYNFDPEKYPEMDAIHFAAFIGAFYNVVREWIIAGAKQPAEYMARIFSDIWHHR